MIGKVNFRMSEREGDDLKSFQYHFNEPAFFAQTPFLFGEPFAFPVLISFFYLLIDTLQIDK